jgi:hypothetical protein
LVDFKIELELELDQYEVMGKYMYIKKKKPRRVFYVIIG